MAAAAGMPRQARLRRAADFDALRQANSGRIGGRCFVLRYGNNEVGNARMGLAISKRVSKRAVDRNRLKRLARESFRRALPGLPPVDIVVTAHTIALECSGAELLAELDELFARVRPLKAAQPTGTIAR